jgi:hypothetical protein
MPRVKLNGPAVFGWSGLFYVWTASDAATFRFACGSVRRSPKHSTQSWPGATPQEGKERRVLILALIVSLSFK